MSHAWPLSVVRVEGCPKRDMLTSHGSGLWFSAEPAVLFTLQLVDPLVESESQGSESLSGRDVSHERPHSVVRYKFPQVFEV